MNTELMFSSKSDMWATPRDFYEKLDQEFNFTCDVCSIPEDAKHINFYSPEIDGLLQEWSGVCWCNPPYSDIASWTKKAVTEAYRGVTTVMLIPSRTDTKYFHNDILRYSILNSERVNFSIETELRFIPGRLKFTNRTFSSFNAEGNYKLSPAPFPSVLVIFRKKGQEKPLIVLKDWTFKFDRVEGVVVEHVNESLIGEEVESGKLLVKNLVDGWVESKNYRYRLI